MTYENDPNRPLGTEPYVERPVARESAGMGWGIPLAVAALVLIGGLFLFTTGGDRTTTASNNRGPITNNVPTQTPAPMPPNTVPTR